MLTGCRRTSTQAEVSSQQLGLLLSHQHANIWLLVAAETCKQHQRFTFPPCSQVNGELQRFYTVKKKLHSDSFVVRAADLGILSAYKIIYSCLIKDFLSIPEGFLRILRFICDYPSDMSGRL